MKVYVKPELEAVTFVSEENLLLTPIDLTPSNIEGGFDERN